MDYIQYAHPLDRGYYLPENDSPKDYSQKLNSSLTPTNIGIGANPMQHQLQALNARLREGASKVEFSFFGSGKGNSQQFTPESFGKAEREDMRLLAEINNVRTSTHATVGVQGLAGFNPEQGGFDERTRQRTLSEIDKAIEFAAEASTGGAIVFHTGEWQRPLTNLKKIDNDVEFESFDNEEKEEVYSVVDSETGKISQLKRNQYFYEPEFLTAKDIKDKLKKDSQGNYVDSKGNIIHLDDWVDSNNNKIDPLEVKSLFERVPKFKSESTEFKTKKLTFDDMKARAERIAKEKGIELPVEVYIQKNQILNEALKLRANSIFYGKSLNYNIKRKNNYLETLKKIKEMKKIIPKKDWNEYMVDQGLRTQLRVGNISLEDPEEIVTQELHAIEDELRHIHETSASADAQARELIEKANKIYSIEQYGLKKTADSIAKAAMKTFELNKMHKDKLKEDLYLAPENLFPEGGYGAHPTELTNIVKTSREEFANRMFKQGRVESMKEAKELAEKHIKSTIDVGHFNVWRKNMKRKEGETPEEFNNRFNNWMIDNVKKMAKEKVLGHIHLSDNFGYDDEHLSVGQGNAPIKEFVKVLEKAGVKDIIVETGSFNPTTGLADAWEHLDTNVYNMARIGGNTRQFSQFKNTHAGYNAPAFYIVGAYSPSNDFRLWSNIPLE